MINKVYVKFKEFIKENLWFLISLLAIILIFSIELPYKVEAPGGFASLNDRIKVEGENETNGEMGMAYVSMINGNIPFILLSYINNDWDLIPKDDLKLNNEEMKDAEKRSKLYLNEAVSNATLSAYNLANKEVKILSKKILVAYNMNDNSNLKVGDEIIAINDQQTNDLDELHNILQTFNANDEVTVKVIRDDKEMLVSCHIQEEHDRKILGVIIINNYELDTNPKLTVNNKSNESGPSGGLMMALSIYDKLTSSNLTNGDKIIGTGTISENGKVGEIDGIKYKLIGAVKNNAKVFLCPKENYEEASNIAKERNYDIIIKDVETLNDAINYLKER